MPDISLLEPTILNGVISRMPPADNLLGHQIVSRQPWPDTSWRYDIISSRRHISRPNTPNSPAIIVDQNGVGQMQGGFIYTREKKVFSPTVTRWLRAPGELARGNAEAQVLMEVQELRDRLFRWEEFLIWKMLAVGSFDLTALGHAIAVDYGIQASHMPTAPTAWTSPLANLVDDIQDIKRIVSRDSDARLTTFYGNGPTLETFYNHMVVQSMLSDPMKSQRFLEGTLPRFQQMSFIEYDRGYTDDFTNPATPVFVPYIPNGYLVGTSDGGPRTHAYLDGPAADWEAPDGHTGPFSKSWREPDPSNRQVLIESQGMPVLYQPDQMVILKIF